MRSQASALETMTAAVALRARLGEVTARMSEFEDDDIEREADDFRSETDDMSSRTDNVSYRQLTCATDGMTLGRRRECEVANGRREIPE
jgi:hypothetical protein